MDEDDNNSNLFVMDLHMQEEWRRSLKALRANILGKLKKEISNTRLLESVIKQCLVQVENEYGSIRKAYGGIGHSYMTWAANIAIGLDTSVPWVMCKQDDTPHPVEVILNGDSPAPTRVIDGVFQPVASATVEQRLAKKNELKAHGTLLMALPNKHQLKFNTHKDAKMLMEAIEKRNKTDLEEQSLDDLFNSLKIYEAEVKSSSSASTSTQNIAFLSSSNTDSTTEPVSAAASVSTVSAKIPVSALPNVDSLSNVVLYSFFASQSNGLQLDNDDLIQIDADDLEEMDLKWKMTMLTVECYNCHKKGHFARECSYDWSFQADEEPTNYAIMAFSSSSSSSDNELRDNALVVLRQNLKNAEQERDDLKLKLKKFQTSSKNFSELLATQTNDKTGLGYNSQVLTRAIFDCDDYLSSRSDESLPPSPIYDRYQSGSGYHVVPPPYTGTFMPPKLDLVFNNAPNDVETNHLAFKVELSPTKHDNYLSHTHRPSASIIEDWVSDSEDESQTKIPQNVPSFVQPTEQVKSLRPSVKHVETSIPTSNSKTTIPKATSNGKCRNRKACFVCKILDHLIKDSVLNQSKLVSITAVRPVSTAVPKIKVSRPRQATPVITKSNSPPKRHINRSPSPKASTFPSKVTAVKAPMNPDCTRDLECNFLENKPNVAGSGPTWLFDIDTLTKIINYHLVTAGNQSTPSAGVQEQFDVEKAREEFVKQYVLFLVWSSGSTNPQNTDEDAAFDEKEPEFEGRKPEFEVNVSPSSSAQSKKHDDKTKREANGKSPIESLTGYRNLSPEFEDFFDNNINEDNAAGTLVPVVGQLSPNSTNTFSAAGPSNAVASPTQGKSSYMDSSQLPDDPNMPKLEDITYFDDKDVGAEADFNNLETSITISHIPTTSIHKDHPVTQIIGTKWVFRNTKDERDIVVRNKARLVARGHNQEEGIDYKEVFTPVARIEAIRLLLAYASFMGSMVYQMDVKSAFLYETIKEEEYVCQPLGFEDPDYPDKVNKVVKALYGLHQAPRAWQKGDILLVQIYVDDIIFGSTNKYLCKAFEKLMKDKFQMSLIGELTLFLDGKSVSTPIDTEKPLLMDPDGEDADVHTYRSMIGSLMYLTSSRPDIMFAAEYVAAASCCTQVLWIQNQLLDYGISSLSIMEVVGMEKGYNPGDFECICRQKGGEKGQYRIWVGKRKYQSLKKKPVSIAQARKNMIIYLKNMDGYKMENFRGMTYDKRKRVTDETLLQESFKKLKAVEVSVKEKFSSAVPSVNNEKALWVELKRLFEPDADDVLWKLQRYMPYPLTWKLYTNCGVHQVSSTTRKHDMFMLTKKDYPLSNAVMILMLSGKLQVEEDNEMARDLVMKIFMEANKPKSKILDTSSK
nr:hypothetical protein [Tanacetum cinerariifolium]